MTKGNKTASYTYDMSGVRSGKVVNGVSYEYTTLSGKITRMTWSGNAVDIVYDDAGRPYLLRYTPSGGATQTYYYVLNLQGDVVGLMNTSMQMVVKYSYDPWGKLTGTTATSAYVALAQANPLRYRSYCYDIETGFYYLQSRYYDPTIARFINADGYLSTDSTGLLSYNMFAYCENNPVMYSDPTGESILGTIALNALYGALSGVFDYWLETVLYGEEFEVGEALKCAGIGAFQGAVGAIVPKNAANAIKLTGVAINALITLVVGICSGDEVYDVFSSIGYDIVYSALSILIEKQFKDPDMADKIARGLTDVIVRGETSILDEVTVYVIDELSKNKNNDADYIVSSPGSARTKVHCER